ncbi:MAG: hypothetical protein U0I35_00775, partial [Dorea formicigenerans]|nr:hypothetical protein [Dorea formicigenerans]
TITIQPNDTLKVTIAPKDSLATGVYQATLTVTADNTKTATTELQFAVNEHDYVAVVTPPSCAEKGYMTYTCRNCGHIYKGNEVDATGHTWGEWEVIKEATITETGKKERVCERCDYKETAVISMISNEEQPTTSTKPDTAVKTGDSTNILEYGNGHFPCRNADSIVLQTQKKQISKDKDRDKGFCPFLIPCFRNVFLRAQTATDGVIQTRWRS